LLSKLTRSEGPQTRMEFSIHARVWKLRGFSFFLLRARTHYWLANLSPP